MHTLSLAMILLGVAALVASLSSVLSIFKVLQDGSVRRSWIGLGGLIVLFIIGYLVIGILDRHSNFNYVGFIVSAILMAGGCFVLIVAHLAHKTAKDILRLVTLERDVILDPLTAIFNRRYFDARLSEEVARAKRYNLPLSTMLIDIDHFKLVNDSHGHQTGDLVLQRTCALIERVIRTSDTVARFGGEELVVICPDTNEQAVFALAERVRLSIESEVVLSGGLHIAITASIGVASLQLHQTAQDLVHGADKALYAAKDAGRNRVRVNNDSPLLEASLNLGT